MVPEQFEEMLTVPLDLPVWPTTLLVLRTYVEVKFPCPSKLTEPID